MSFGTVQVGRIVLVESLARVGESVDAGDGVRTLTLQGQESTPPQTLAEVKALHDDVLGSTERLVPVIFTNKSDRNGYYMVSDANSDMDNWINTVLKVNWKFSLERIGTQTEIDIESRLSGAQTRTNDHALTSGVKWHAPPIGHTAYWSSTTQPSVVTRTGADGAHVVYLGVPTATNPRYNCSVSNYLNGRVRFIDSDAHERTGTTFLSTATGWELNNGLVRVKPLASSGNLEISAYTGAAWQTKEWDVRKTGVSLGAIDHVTLLRNDPECIIVRLLWELNVGRVTADLTLRRGSRFVELYVQSQFSDTLGIVRGTTEAAIGATGYIRASANDAATNRFVIGSARTFTNDLVNGGISKASTTTLDAFIGVIAAGSGAVTGDTGDDLRNQYLGAPSEMVRGIKR